MLWGDDDLSALSGEHRFEARKQRPNSGRG